MIVVAIIGILAAIGIPQYQNYVARAQVAEALALIAPAKLGVAEYYSTNGEMPPEGSNIEDITGLEAADLEGSYVSGVEWMSAASPCLPSLIFPNPKISTPPKFRCSKSPMVSGDDIT